MAKKYSIGLALGLLIASSTPSFAEESDRFIERADTKSWFKEMETKHNFKSADLAKWFKDAKVQPKALAAIQKPSEALPWYRYKKIFLSKERAEAGAKFWQDNEATLKKAEATYGVSASVIVAILGVETYYGRQKGQFPVLDTLATLAFDYPPRAPFFRQELEQFLLLAREEKLDPTKIYGSYAGAMGTPQFISSSYRHYAVDFNNDGQRNLLDSTEDSIGSVANYFKVHGWKLGEPVVIQANIKGDAFKTALSPLNNPKPERTLTAFKKLGVDSKLKQDFPAALIPLETEAGPEYYLGLNNFYVITRYNRSSLYAMAVYQLSQDIEAIYKNNTRHG